MKLALSSRGRNEDGVWTNPVMFEFSDEVFRKSGRTTNWYMCLILNVLFKIQKCSSFQKIFQYGFFFLVPTSLCNANVVMK